MAGSILAITWDTKLCQICWWNINNNISFYYRLFPRKTNITKNPKNPTLDPFWSFLPKLGAKKNFSEKKGCQFFNILITYHCAKHQKSLMGNSWENCWSDTPKTSLFHQFLCEIQPVLESCDWFKNHAVWLAKSSLGHISETRIFPNMKCVQAYKNCSNTNFHYRPRW